MTLRNIVSSLVIDSVKDTCISSIELAGNNDNLIVIPSEILTRWGTVNFNIYVRTDGSFYSDLDPTVFRPVGITNYFSPTGNDTTGDGSIGNPYRTLQKGLTLNTVNYMLLSGDYTRSFLFTTANLQLLPTKSMAFIAVDGAGTVTMSRSYDNLTWVQEGSPNTDVYATTLPASPTIEMVVDRANGQAGKYLADGTTLVPTKLTSVASVAACQAAPNSYYLTGTTLYVHTFNNRAPDANIFPISQEGFIWWFNNSAPASTDTLYYEGINTFGRRFGRTQHEVANNNTFVMYQCNSHFSIEASMAPVRIQGTKNVIVKDFRFSDFTLADGVSLSMGVVGTQTAAPNGLFENCDGWDMGSNTGANNFNIFTGHQGANAIAINCTGARSYGPLFAWVEGCYAMELNCYGTTSLSSVNNAQKSIHQIGGLNPIDGVTRSKLWSRGNKASGTNWARSCTAANADLYEHGDFVDKTTQGDYTGTVVTPWV